jgi:hypothetical protein
MFSYFAVPLHAGEAGVEKTAKATRGRLKTGTHSIPNIFIACGECCYLPSYCAGNQAHFQLQSVKRYFPSRSPRVAAPLISALMYWVNPVLNLFTINRVDDLYVIQYLQGECMYDVCDVRYSVSPGGVYVVMCVMYVIQYLQGECMCDVGVCELMCVCDMFVIADNKAPRAATGSVRHYSGCDTAASAHK